MALQQPENGVKFGQFWAIWTVFVLIRGCSGNCAFDAIFNFGDSNSDTGAYFAAFPPTSGPYSTTRVCNGRLIIDFIAEALRLPFLSPYLQSIGSDYRHGVNFATAGSTVLFPNTSVFVSGTSPFALQIQLNQFKLFKSKIDNQTNAKGSDKLPPPDIFGRSLYTIYIGQNDFTTYNSASRDVVGDFKEYLSHVNGQIVETIKELYGLGARTFLVLNLAPLGCYPSTLVVFPHSSTDLDEFGCIASYNKAVDDYNKMLEFAIDEARKALSNASLVFADTHAVFQELFQHPTSHGLKYTTRACCGYGGGAYNYNRQVYCRTTAVINGSTATATPCTDPQHYISWDGIHNTEAANKLVADVILKGNITHPRFSLAELCGPPPLTSLRHLVPRRSDPHIA